MDGRAPSTSVILATNRGGPFVRAAVDSVVSQSTGDWELLVVDDGSPIEVAHDLDHLMRLDPRIRVIHQAARGVSVARNVGTAAARGTYVSYLDDDDVWHPERLALQVAQLERTPQAAVCYSAGWTIDETGATLDEGWLPTGVPRRSLLLGEVDLPRIVTMVIRRDEVCALGGFNPAFRYCEDDELILRMLIHCEFTSVPQALVGYRRHSGNTSGTNPPLRQYTGERIRLLQYWAAQAMDDPELTRLIDKNLDRFRRRLADYAASESLAHARRGNLRVASAQVRQALRFSPAGTATTYRRKFGRVLSSRRSA